MGRELEGILISSEYDKNVDETAKKILREVKMSRKTYREVKDTLNKFSRSLIYENSERYSYLLSVIRTLLEEINDLLVTNR